MSTRWVTAAAATLLAMVASGAPNAVGQAVLQQPAAATSACAATTAGIAGSADVLALRPAAAPAMTAQDVQTFFDGAVLDYACSYWIEKEPSMRGLLA